MKADTIIIRAAATRVKTLFFSIVVVFVARERERAKKYLDAHAY
jgi:hypothetical protein